MHRKPAERLKNLALAILTTGLLFFSIGCVDRAPCEDLSCVGGDRVGCECICDAFYEGALCDTLARQKFLGSNWYNNRTCASGIFLVSEIVADTNNPGAVVLKNLHENGDVVWGEVSGDTLQIPTQVHGLEYIEGEGIYSQGNIAIQYKVIQTGGQETACVAQLSR